MDPVEGGATLNIALRALPNEFGQLVLSEPR